MPVKICSELLVHEVTFTILWLSRAAQCMEKIQM